MGCPRAPPVKNRRYPNLAREKRFYEIVPTIELARKNSKTVHVSDPYTDGIYPKFFQDKKNNFDKAERTASECEIWVSRFLMGCPWGSLSYLES